MQLDPSLLRAVEALAADVGRYQCQHFRIGGPGGGENKNEAELVSEVDRESERRLVEGLQALLPQAGIFGEESGKQGSQELVWIIDPVDGTTNYLSGLDQFSISIALVEDGKPRLGVVHRPVSHEFFSAMSGQSFTHNRQTPVAVTSDLQLEQALIGTGFPYRSADLARAFFPCMEEVLYQSRGIRRMGSAALDLSYLASGYFQGFWESDLAPYDVAAGILFLQQHGCVVTNHLGKPFDMFNDRLLVAGWPGVHRLLQPIIERHYAPLLG